MRTPSAAILTSALMLGAVIASAPALVAAPALAQSESESHRKDPANGTTGMPQKTSQEPAMDRRSGAGAPSQAGTQTEQTQEQLELMMEGDKIIGMKVIGSDGQSVGQVKDVVVGTDGQMQSAIIETGGFLGMGGRLVAVPINRLQIDGDRINADLTREKAADMPEHKGQSGK